MKKWIAALLAALTLLALTACGSEKEVETAQTAEAATAASGSDIDVSKAPPSATDTETTTETAAAETPTAETSTETDSTVLDEEMYHKAETFIDNSVDELILAIGQPLHKQEAEDSTEDEPKYILTYPGFYVYSTRVTAGEMIDDVKLMSEN